MQCLGCRHYEWGWLDDDRCEAFPDGIPAPIWIGEVDHSAPYPGDGGVVREPQSPTEGQPSPVQLRHDAWSQRVLVDGIERVAHEADPLGALVVATERTPLDVEIDPETLREAWRTTRDCAAALIVMLRARRTAELSQALEATWKQLDAEGCDYLDDKGWLGISLRLASLQREEELANVRTAWGALAPPYGGEYTSARVEHTLLRAIRRVMPEPPAAAEWGSPDLDPEEIGPLHSMDDATCLPRVRRMRTKDVKLLEPWTQVTNARDLEAELARELVPGHRLHGRKDLRAFARNHEDDVVFVGETLVAVVHLTWAKETRVDRPEAEIHPSLDEWTVRRMVPDHRRFVREEPRAFAFDFRSPCSFEEMVTERLPAPSRWEWIVRESGYYGEYVWGKSGATRVRIFRHEEDDRLTVQVDLVGHDGDGEGWYPMMRAVTKVQILGPLDATDIADARPEYD